MTNFTVAIILMGPAPANSKQDEKYWKEDIWNSWFDFCVRSECSLHVVDCSVEETQLTKQQKETIQGFGLAARCSVKFVTIGKDDNTLEVTLEVLHKTIDERKNDYGSTTSSRFSDVFRFVALDYFFKTNEKVVVVECGVELTKPEELYDTVQTCKTQFWWPCAGGLTPRILLVAKASKEAFKDNASTLAKKLHLNENGKVEIRNFLPTMMGLHVPGGNRLLDCKNQVDIGQKEIRL